MPLPKPKNDEDKKDFLDRCMADEVMNTEYPDNKQRYAICNQIWTDKDKEKKSMSNEIERRSINLLELRLVQDDNKKPKIEGHAAMFDKLWDADMSQMLGFQEKVAPGAFANSIRKDDIRALFNHDPNYVLGRNKAKTLKLKEDDLGLYIEIDPPETQWAKDLQESIRRGDVSQMSFGFIVLKDSWVYTKGKDAVRTLEEVKLMDISPVTFPAYPQTSVTVRDYLKALKEAEDKKGETGDLKGQTPNLVSLKWKIR